MKIPADLLAMLTYRRPAWSDAESKFIERFIHPLGAESDDFGNMMLRIGTAPVLWSCHTDTVHKNEGRQTIGVSDGVVKLAKGSKVNCLGADDAAGVWLIK